MALTIDGSTVLPAFGGASTGMGVGAGALGGGIAGLLIGGLLSGKNGGLFGGNNSNDVQYEALQGQINNLSGQLASGDIQDSIARNQADIASLSTAVATGNFTTLSSINSLGRDVVTNVHQSELTQLNSFNQLSTGMLQGFNGQAMQVQNTTNQIISQLNAMAAAQSACCCELKGVIGAEGAATRALINDLNVQNLRDQLSAANNKVSNNEQNQYLLTTILNHLHPVVS